MKTEPDPTGACAHRRQVARVSLVNGIAEFERAEILPCADPDCPETWQVEKLVVNPGSRFFYERYKAFDGWRWISSGDRSVAEEREACAKIELYFYGCANAVTSHVCNDARGVQHAKDCVIHDAEGTLTATCVAVCP